jgi:hypothetical protein
MTSPFDSPPITRGETDNRYLSFATSQTLTPDQQSQAQANLGVIGGGGGGGSQVVVETDPDGVTVLVVTTP